jgi:hypothetical protein
MFETVFIRKIMGTSSIGLGYKLKMPIIGRVLRWNAEKMIHSESENRNPFRADGHFGQVLSLEDANRPPRLRQVPASMRPSCLPPS